jgi:uncharacterized membrane protein YgaE (UPF0421/DUF939 family)
MSRIFTWLLKSFVPVRTLLVMEIETGNYKHLRTAADDVISCVLGISLSINLIASFELMFL